MIPPLLSNTVGLIVMWSNVLSRLYYGDFMTVGMLVVIEPIYYFTNSENKMFLKVVFHIIMSYLCGLSFIIPLVFFYTTSCMFGYTDETYTYGKCSYVTVYKLGSITYFSYNHIKCGEDAEIGMNYKEHIGYVKVTRCPDNGGKIDDTAMTDDTTK